MLLSWLIRYPVSEGVLVIRRLRWIASLVVVVHMRRENRNPSMPSHGDHWNVRGVYQSCIHHLIYELDDIRSVRRREQLEIGLDVRPPLRMRVLDKGVRTSVVVALCQFRLANVLELNSVGSIPDLVDYVCETVHLVLVRAYRRSEPSSRSTTLGLVFVENLLISVVEMLIQVRRIRHVSRARVPDPRPQARPQITELHQLPMMSA